MSQVQRRREGRHGDHELGGQRLLHARRGEHLVSARARDPVGDRLAAVEPLAAADPPQDAAAGAARFASDTFMDDLAGAARRPTRASLAGHVARAGELPRAAAGREPAWRGPRSPHLKLYQAVARPLQPRRADARLPPARPARPDRCDPARARRSSFVLRRLAHRRSAHVEHGLGRRPRDRCRAELAALGADGAPTAAPGEELLPLFPVPVRRPRADAAAVRRPRPDLERRDVQGGRRRSSPLAADHRSPREPAPDRASRRFEHAWSTPIESCGPADAELADVRRDGRSGTPELRRGVAVRAARPRASFLRTHVPALWAAIRRVAAAGRRG